MDAMAVQQTQLARAVAKHHQVFAQQAHRHWHFAADGKVAYFDEDLDTWMQGCRGSGIFVLEKGEWRLAYYNLTVLIENEKIKPFIELRKQ